mmetsp:Transcript_17712/g.35715  ORF Transcript_17712/g.35715 Transcript_17712/m.35715 type:complete len:402 (-) Transcript_17712:382-1587(-)
MTAAVGGSSLEDGGLFERPGYRGEDSSSMPTGSGPISGPAPGSSLFDRYASDTPTRSYQGNGTTATSRMRASGVKIACYLNTECNRGRSTIVHLPGSVDTMAEVFPMIQRRMKLDERMLYAAELFLPDGQRISSFKQLREAADMDTAIIVGCGEPFDSSTIPQSMLSFHTHGGGRIAPKVVKKELADKKLRGAQLKADQVRASGHGLDSSAAQAARLASVEAHREAAAEMRHDYMNQLLDRASQQTEMIRYVQANNAAKRTEKASREQAKRSVWSEGRMQDLAESRRTQSNVFRERHDKEEQRYAQVSSQAKQIREDRDAGAKASKTMLTEQKKAAGLERRMSHISRSVERAEKEHKLVASHQERRLSISGGSVSGSRRSPLTSQTSVTSYHLTPSVVTSS